MSTSTSPASFKLEACQFWERPQLWRDVAPPFVNPIPSMITPDEATFLYWISRDIYTGEGSILDMGPLAGGSTYALASGLRDNEAVQADCKSGRIQSFDLWRYLEDHQVFFPDLAKPADGDLLPAVIANLGALSTFVTHHKGDINLHKFQPQPVEIAFVDIAKTPETWHHIAHGVLPSLIPGGLLLQQDLVSVDCPWLQMFMVDFAEYFEIMDSPIGGTVAYRLTKPLPLSAISAYYDSGDDYQHCDVDLAVEKFACLENQFVGLYRLVIRSGAGHFLASRGRYQEVEEIINSMLRDPDYDEGSCGFCVRYLQAMIP